MEARSSQLAEEARGEATEPATAHLRNTYYLLRHGTSVANEKDIIVSCLENGTKAEWGLSDLGREQAERAGEHLLELLGHFDASRLRFYSSPFSRAVETAARAASHLEVHRTDDRFALAPELRERGFGAEYELAPTSNYEQVWEADVADSSTCPPGGGESVDDVAARLRLFMACLEARHNGCNIVLVSHGDALSILAAVVLGTPLGAHRQHGLPNCGILELP